MSLYERCRLCTLELRGERKWGRQLRLDNLGTRVLPPKAKAQLEATLAELNNGTTEADLSDRVHYGRGFPCHSVLTKEWTELDGAPSRRAQSWKPAPQAPRPKAAPRGDLRVGPDDASVDELFGSGGSMQTGMKTRAAKLHDPHEEARAAAARHEARAALEAELEAAADRVQAPVDQLLLEHLP